ncbi:MAG: hypothetical protein ACRD0I_09550 [Acidimicrobiales bacterium]
MLDHVLLDVIAAIRRAFDAALLERQAVEERFQVDVFLGDLSWETSYSLPGEGSPPRVRADLSLDWPTWSQSAYRSWSIGEPAGDPPELVIEVALRIQRLAELPDTAHVLAVLPPESPPLGRDTLERSGPTVEQVYAASGSAPPQAAVEVSYQGTYRLDEASLEDPGKMEDHMSELGRWVASTLVRLGDLGLKYLPPEALDAG